MIILSALRSTLRNFSVELDLYSSASTSASVSEYVAEHRGATPDEALRECDLNEDHREQVNFYLANTRYTLYKDTEGNDTNDLRWDNVEWTDVADWTIS